MGDCSFCRVEIEKKKPSESNPHFEEKKSDSVFVFVRYTIENCESYSAIISTITYNSVERAKNCISFDS